MVRIWLILYRACPKKHDVSKKKTGQFKTTGGSIINVPVPSAGQTVDGNKLMRRLLMQ